jgi:hypothetical protein
MELLADSEAEAVATDDGSMRVLLTVSIELDTSVGRGTYTELPSFVAEMVSMEDDSIMVLLMVSTELAISVG